MRLDMSILFQLMTIVLLALCACIPSCSPLTFTVGLTPADQAFTEKLVDTDPQQRTNDKIAIVDINGLILNTRPKGFLSEGTNPVADLQEKLRLAANDPDVKAVILRVNTPGGTVTASDVMFREVERFKKRTGKPVVVLMMDLATSGGYYVSLAGDHLIAYPTTITGSVGVIVQVVSLQPALSNIGITADAITSGSNKAAGNPLAPFTPDQRQTLQALVDDFYAKFRNQVRTHRPQIPADQFDMITDGRVFSGTEALKLKLIDEIGDLYTAWDQAKVMSGVEAANLVLYHRPMRYVGSPYSRDSTEPAYEQTQDIATQINVLQVNLESSDAFGATGGAGFWYVWRADLP